MRDHDARPTLLIFTLGAERETRRRRLLPRRFGDDERALHRACLDAAVAAGRGAGCRVMVSGPDVPRLAADVARVPQRGRGFGDRLTRALDRAFAAGGPVVVVGTDVPGLRAEHVRAALGRLAGDPGEVVAGPSPDGGFYLLAAARPITGLAARVAWRRPRALATLRRLLADLGRPLRLLTPLGDLDRRADLERWLARAASSPLSRRLTARLRRLLATLRRPHAEPGCRPRLDHPRVSLFARGPPLTSI